jgi:hypothetical protein
MEKYREDVVEIRTATTQEYGEKYVFCCVWLEYTAMSEIEKSGKVYSIIQSLFPDRRESE